MTDTEVVTQTPAVTTEYSGPAPSALASREYSGPERRNLGSTGLPPKGAEERRKTPWPAVAPFKPKVQLRAKFTVSEVTRTGRGVSLLKLSAQSDHTIKGDAILLPGSSPVGEITLQADQKFADLVQIGSTFYLVSA
jgi:hypothetical protein